MPVVKDDAFFIRKIREERISFKGFEDAVTAKAAELKKAKAALAASLDRLEKLCDGTDPDGDNMFDDIEEDGDYGKPPESVPVAVPDKPKSAKGKAKAEAEAETESATDPTDPDAWRSVQLVTIEGIPPAGLKALKKAKITTIGQMAEYSKKHHIDKISGIGMATAEKIDDAMVRYWAANPRTDLKGKQPPAPVATEPETVTIPINTEAAK